MLEMGLPGTLKYYMKRFGFRLTQFYYMKETLPAKTPPDLIGVRMTQDPRSPRQCAAEPEFIALPDGFEFSIFSLEDVMTISSMPERADYIYAKFVVDKYNKGDICLGIKFQGEIAAFSWFSLDKCHSPLYFAEMGSKEAYLYDMYVKKAYRGRNLAPVLRYKSYEVLRGMGRDTFYSITERSNTASFRFKQKLNAQIVFLGLFVELFRKFRRTWVLKRYK